MCHICRKVQILESYDYKATKPVFLAVSKLHKHVKPHLGDIWLLRYNETARLRKLLGSLHKLVPFVALTEILNEVDNEMEYIKQQMSEHPPRLSTGRWEELKGSITPSESPSVRISRQKKLEAKGRCTEHAEKCTKIFSKLKETNNFHEALRELSGSVLDPPPFIVAQSTKLVEDWLDRCDIAMASEVSEETDSLASLLGGGIAARPAMDISLWKTVIELGRRSITAPIIDTRVVRSRFANKVARTSDCVYHRPLKKLGLDSELGERLNETGTNMDEKAQKGRFIVKLYTFFRRKKNAEQKTRDKQAGTTKENASRNHDDQVQENKAWKPLMRGGRSSGGSVSVPAVAPASRRSSSSTERHLHDQQASRLSDITENRPQMSNKPRDTVSDPNMSSLLSSRSSNINFGSLMEHPLSPSELADRGICWKQREKSPDIFVPTTSEPIAQSTPRYSHVAKQLRRRPSFRPLTLEPIKHAYESPSKGQQTLRKVPAESTPEPGGFVREKMQLGGEGQGISVFAANREIRQADRTTNAAGKFRRPEGQTANVDEGVSEFNKNRARRRSERVSVGLAWETKGEGAAKTTSTENKSNKVMMGFNVEEQVACGAAWERRMKKAQAFSKKPVSEMYRAEERQKYWNPQKS